MEVLVAVINLVGTLLAALIPVLAGRKREAPAGPPAATIALASWTAFHAAGAATNGILAGVIGEMAPHIGNWAFFGAMIGGAQWLALRAVGSQPRFWVIAAIVGWVPFAFFNTAVTWAFCGGLAAVLQIAFARRVVASPLVWIGVNVIGWLIAGNIGWAVGMLLLGSLGFPLAWTLGWLVVGLVGGAATGWGARRALTA